MPRAFRRSWRQEISINDLDAGQSPSAASSGASTKGHLRSSFGNVVLVWLRIVLSGVFVLLSTKFTLQALGAADLGIYWVSAGIGIFFGFLTGSVTTLSQRTLAFAMARGSPSLIREAFATCLKTHIIASVGFGILGIVFGHMFIAYGLNIPAPRIFAAQLVLDMVVVTSIFGIILAPFEALLWSNSRFLLTSTMGVLGPASTMLVAILSQYAPFDPLLFYALGVTVTSIFWLVIGALFVLVQIPESRVTLGQIRHAKIDRESRALIVWNSLGSLGLVTQQQGIVFIVSIFFGPAAVAAVGISNQLVSLLRQVGLAVVGVLSPALYRQSAVEGHHEMIASALLGSKYVLMIVALPAIPIWMELPTLLNLWLKTPPPDIVPLARILILSLMVEITTAQLFASWQAIGKVGELYRALLALAGGSLLLTYAVGLLKLPIEVMALCIIATATAMSVVRVVKLEEHVPGVTRQWGSQTLTRGVLALVPPAAATFLVGIVMPAGIGRVFVSGVVGLVTGVTACILIGLSHQERQAVLSATRLRPRRST